MSYVTCLNEYIEFGNKLRTTVILHDFLGMMGVRVWYGGGTLCEASKLNTYKPKNINKQTKNYTDKKIKKKDAMLSAILYKRIPAQMTSQAYYVQNKIHKEGNTEIKI